MLSMIVLIVYTKTNIDVHNEMNNEQIRKKKPMKYPEGKTLIVCQTWSLSHWKDKVLNKCISNLLSVETYRSSLQESAKNLATFDVVITSNITLISEYKNNCMLYKIKWKRIIIDDSMAIIKSRNNQMAEAVCALVANKRWALTNKPVETERDVYSILKFLNCSPLDNRNVWEEWIKCKDTGTQSKKY
ncbi:PREDICTED: transcription termination factor 2-like isoform X2 [Wasmannia auropunctata]|uniref:transcription termination factor 2-like isoform X2 n=1 Tax=Wasmannia auropunctata TaxID=64793 RepID=UPI0005EE9A87|nr:PREDICTED: transcription termination factor 2-like isoform X2 [Wasmannia auropunctata]